MKRTIYIKRIPDAINHSVSREYVQIPKSFLKNPNISIKAKIILCLLLSNKKGWISYNKTLGTMLKEGKDTINTGLKELILLGYLKKIKYRDIRTKQFKGTFWAYTDVPFLFNYNTNLVLNDFGYELYGKKPINVDINGYDPQTADPHTENPCAEKPLLIKLNEIKLKEKKFIKKENPIINFFQNNNVPKVWQEVMTMWFDYKRSIGDTYKNEQSLSKHYTLIKNISNNDVNIAKQCYEMSMANNYRGVFPLKTKNPFPPINTPKNLQKTSTVKITW